jgi:hypothetical protein
MDIIKPEKPIIEINEPSRVTSNIKVIPEPGKFYYIDYTDAEEPEGSYFGLAKCMGVYSRNRKGEQIYPPLYEFMHPTKEGDQTLSLFYASEVVMEA